LNQDQSLRRVRLQPKPFVDYASKRIYKRLPAGSIYVSDFDRFEKSLSMEKKELAQ
jgi:hypothetical protein